MEDSDVLHHEMSLEVDNLHLQLVGDVAQEGLGVGTIAPVADDMASLARPASWVVADSLLGEDAGKRGRLACDSTPKGRALEGMLPQSPDEEDGTWEGPFPKLAVARAEQRRLEADGAAFLGVEGTKHCLAGVDRPSCRKRQPGTRRSVLD